MTLSFLYFAVLLLGFTLALVTGLVRRLLHPTELCDGVVIPSHEHWFASYTPTTDKIISFATLFGAATFVAHGVATLDPLHELAIGVGAGVVGLVSLRVWVGRVCDPSRQLANHRTTGTVVREIPASGYGQVEIMVSGVPFKLAARSGNGQCIHSGTQVNVLDRQESVVVVIPCQA